MLKPGEVMPFYSGQAVMPNGRIEPISLADYRNVWSVVFFWPMDFTFVCPTEIRGFNELAKEFEQRHCKLLGASIDSVYVHAAWIRHGLGKVDFPLIGDVDRSLASGFGVLDEQGVALRATFIVNPKGIIESCSANALSVGRSPHETLRLLCAFQTGELTGCEWKPGDEFVQAR